MQDINDKNSIEVLPSKEALDDVTRPNYHVERDLKKLPWENHGIPTVTRREDGKELDNYLLFDKWDFKFLLEVMKMYSEGCFQNGHIVKKSIGGNEYRNITRPTMTCSNSCYLRNTNMDKTVAIHYKG
jgi:hypothetical protein